MIVYMTGSGKNIVKVNKQLIFLLQGHPKMCKTDSEPQI